MDIASADTPAPHKAAEIIAKRFDDGKIEPDDATRLFFVISQQQSKHQEGKSATGDYIVWLHDMGKENFMELYLRKLIKETETAEGNEVLLEQMRNIHESILQYMSLKPETGEETIHPDQLIRTVNFNGSKEALKFVVMLAQKNKESVLSFLERIIGSLAKSPVAVNALVKSSVAVSVALPVLQITYEAYMSIKKWKNGRMSGAMCAKNIAVSFCSVAAACVGGYVGGSVIGTFLGTTVGAMVAGPGGAAMGAPIGSALGGSTGAVGASAFIQALADKLFTWLFDLPKSDAIDEAYKYLKVHHRASNAEIRKRYLEMVLECHPDKPGGSDEKWAMLQTSMAIIKLDREGDKDEDVPRLAIKN